MTQLDTLTIILQVLMTLGVYSFLFKHNPYYKLIEHIFVGTAIAWFVAVSILNINDIAVIPMTTQGDITWAIPIVIGVLIFFQLSTRNYWISRYPAAIVIGLGIGLQARGALVAQITSQIQGTLAYPILNAANSTEAITSLLFMIMVLSSLLTFFYWRTGGARTNAFDSIRDILGGRFGRYVIMAALGVFFGKTVTSRISQFVGRSQFLYSPDAIMYTGIMLALLAIMFIVLYLREK
jgi:hypothetical protein